MNTPSLLEFSKSELLVIQNSYAKDCNQQEFDLFISVAKARGLNPLLKHIYAMVMNKDSKDPKKPRQLTIIASIDGQRVIANRTRDYRPDDRAPRFETDPDLKDKDINPAGLISAEVAVYIHRHGDWHVVPHIAYYDEYAPLIDEHHEDDAGRWVKTGRIILDPRKPNWRRMPRILLAKCAEMGALRKAFPDDFSNLYGEEEIDRVHSLDLTASEILAQARAEQRQQMLGGAGILMDFMSGGPLEKVPLGRFYDRCMAFLRDIKGSPNTAMAWEQRNSTGLREFWGVDPGAALALKTELEKAKAEIVEEPVTKEKPKEPAKAKAKTPPPPKLKPLKLKEVPDIVTEAFKRNR